MSILDKIYQENKSPLLWKTRAAIVNGKIFIGEVCKVYGENVWLCNKNGWIEIKQNNLMEVI